MDIPINNQVFNPGPGIDQANYNSPVTSRDTANFSNEIETDLARSRASRLAESGINSRATELLSSKDRLRGLNIIESGWNGIKKLGRSLCLAGGYLSGSAAIVSILFFNIKILGIIFGIPAFLFLYMASTLGREIKKDPTSGTMKDPLMGLKMILEHQPEILRNDPKFVVKTIQSIGDMKKNNPRYYEVLDRLEALKETILMEKMQLRNKEDENSLLYKELMDDYLDEIERTLAQNASVVLASEYTNQYDPLKAMHDSRSSAI